MTRTHFVAGLATVAFTILAAGQTHAGNTTNNKTVNVAPTADTLNAYAQAGRPNINHFSFGVDVVGTWQAATTMWTAPNAAPVTTTAKASFEPTNGMGGRFVSQSFEAETGQNKFFGNAWFGFNNATNQYEFTWIDSTSTNILFYHGTRDQNGAINFTANYADPVDGHAKASRARFSWPSKGVMKYEMWNTGTDGSEFKSLEINYTRLPATVTKPRSRADMRPSTNNTTTTTNNGYANFSKTNVSNTTFTNTSQTSGALNTPGTTKAFNSSGNTPSGGNSTATANENQSVPETFNAVEGTTSNVNGTNHP